MRILHLISSGGMYGAETVLLNLACAQERLGNETIVGVFENRRAPHTEIVAEAKSRGLQVEVFSCSGRLDRKPLEAIRNLIRRRHVSLVHGHGYKSDFYGYLSARHCGVPFVATSHLWTRATPSVRFYEFLDSLILRQAQKVVGVSDAIVQALIKSGVHPAKVSAIYNGTDLSRYAGARPTLREELGIRDRTLIGTVGRLEQQKGLEYLIKASQQALSELPDALVAIVGEGSLRSRLAELLQDLNLESKVLLLGSRTDMPGVYASLDLFVLASVDEGMPMAILEALAAERAVVATRVGAVEKLIIPGETGLLVEARDVPALRDAMLLCLRNQSFARELGRRGEVHVRKYFSAERMAKRYLAVYEQVLEKGKASHAA